MVKTKKQKERYYFHLTDTFGGETNYSWIRRYFADANSLHGALCIISRETGYNFTLVYDGLYHAKGACIALLLEDWETIDYLKDCQIETFNDYKNVTGE